jgi:hypothetical protein
MKDMYRKALEMGNSLHRGPTGNLEGGSFTVDFERQMKGGSGNTASLSMQALQWEPGEGVLY